MNIYTLYFKELTDDYYAAHNRIMFTTREEANKCLNELLDFTHIYNYYILEEEVLEKFVPLYVESNWECGHGTLHPITEECDCDIINEF